MKKLTFLAIISSLLFIQCNKDDNQNESPTSPEISTTKVLIYLHDQPIDYQQVNIDIQEVVIKGYGNSEEIDLGANAGIYNLLDYQNGSDTLLGDITLDFDSIHQIRLVLGPQNSVMVDSILHDMSTPSAQQSGLKINIHGELTYVDTFLISLDFDAEESVHQLGNGSYQLHPVIHLDD